MVDFDPPPLQLLANLRLCLKSNMHNKRYDDLSKVFNSFTPLKPDKGVTE